MSLRRLLALLSLAAVVSSSALGHELGLVQIDGTFLRDGTYVVIAAGRCNHNGYGTWGNDSIGIEAYNNGVGEPWPEVQLDAYRRGCAAICRHLGFNIAQVRGHKETDSGRKIDPTGIDMGHFRTAVAALLSPAPSPLILEDDMFSYEYVTGGQTVLRVVEGGKQTRLTGQAILAKRRASPNHLVVDADDVARFDANYGSAG